MSAAAANAPAPPSAPAGPPAGSTPSGNSSGGAPPNPPSSDSTRSVFVDGILLTERTLMPDPTWPSDLILDRSRSNWEEWSLRLGYLVDRQAFTEWLDGSIPCPDSSLHSRGAQIWNVNDRALRAFILERVSKIDRDLVKRLTTAHEVYEKLRKRHEQIGLHAQVLLIKRALNVNFEPNTSLVTTANVIKELWERIVKMGTFDNDKLLTILLINGLTMNFPQLQSNINGLLNQPDFSSDKVLEKLEDEDALVDRRYEANPNANAASSAHAAIAPNKFQNSNNRPICSNCKRTNHQTDFCILPGGKMAGKTVDEARNAQRAASGKPARPRAQGTSTAQVAQTPTPTPAVAMDTPAITPASLSGPIMFNGQSYMLVPQAPAPATGYSAITPEINYDMSDADMMEYRVFLASEPSTHLTSLDWAAYTRRNMDAPNISPFILDTGATVHISPIRTDFKTFNAIPKHPVKGLGGTSVFAVGMGTVELRIASGHKLILRNVLYIPDATVRLVSVVSLSRDGGYTCHFDSESCWITNKGNAVITRGVISPNQNLYTLSIPSTPRILTQPPSGASAMYAQRIPDVETWHRRLGHCNVRTIVEMARSEAAKDAIVGTKYTGGREGE